MNHHRRNRSTSRSPSNRGARRRSPALSVPGRLVLAIGLGSASVGCGAALNQILGRDSADNASNASADGAKLRDRAEKEIGDKPGGGCILQFEAAGHESWAIDNADRCPEFAQRKTIARDDAKVSGRVEPADGAPTVPVAMPDWCSHYDGWGQGQDFTIYNRRQPTKLRGQESPEQLLRFAHFVAVAGCDRAHYLPRQQWVAQWLQRWVNVTGMDLADTSTLLAELVQHEDALAKSQAIACEGTPLLRALACWEGGTRPSAVEIDLLEGMGKLDDGHRLAYLAGCQGTHCNLDAEAIDWSAVEGMLAADTNLAVLRFAAAAPLAALREAHASSRVDPEVRGAYEAWRKEVPVSDKMVRSAYGVLHAAVHRKPIDACPAGLAAAFDASTAASKPRTVKELQRVLADPRTQLLGRALTLCDKDRPQRNAMRAEFIARTSVEIGPRHAALLAARRGSSPLPPTPKRKANATATVAGVAARGDKSIVRFAPIIKMVPIERCRDTNQADGFNRDGSIRYRERCKVIRREKRSREPLSIVVDSADTAQLKPGRVVWFHSPRPYAATERTNGKIKHDAGDPVEGTIATVHEGGKLRYLLGFDLGL